MGLSKRTKRKYGPRVERPDGVPKVAWPPHRGAVRQWNRRTRRLVNIVEWKFDITCSTYEWHGNNWNNGGGNGKRNAFDAWVHQPGSRATAVQEAYGDRVQNFIENNFRLWFYQIWWNWMRYHYSSWFSYEPYWRDYVKQSGNPNPADNRHTNHIHTQVKKGRLRASLAALAIGVGLVEDRPDNPVCQPPKDEGVEQESPGEWTETTRRLPRLEGLEE